MQNTTDTQPALLTPILRSLLTVHAHLALVDTVEEDKRFGLHHQARDCDKQGTLDCDEEGRWLIQPGDDEERLWRTFTYACDKHLDLVRFEFASELHRRLLEQQREQEQYERETEAVSDSLPDYDAE